MGTVFLWHLLCVKMFAKVCSGKKGVNEFNILSMQYLASYNNLPAIPVFNIEALTKLTDSIIITVIIMHKFTYERLVRPSNYIFRIVQFPFKECLALF